LLNTDTGAHEQLAERLLSALHDHADSKRLLHDDVTFLFAEFVDGPRGPAIWHVIKNRLLRRSGSPA
jgi:hypothetical protein